MNIILATGSDYRYLPRIWPYFESIEKHSRAKRNVVFVPVQGEEDWFTRARSLCKMEWRPVPVKQLKAKNPNNCLQHGEFLDFDDPDGSEDDIVIFTDGDIVLQRWFTADELKWLAALPENGVAVGLNEGPWGSLAREVRLLHPKSDLEAIRSVFPGDWDAMPCYNTGVLIARRSAYRSLCEAYIEAFPKVDVLLGHYAKQQWLLSYLLETGDFEVRNLPGAIHTHGCHPLPLEATRVGNELHFSGNPVMFRHNVEFGVEKERTGAFRHHIYGLQPIATGALQTGPGMALTGSVEGQIRASVIVYSMNGFAFLTDCLKSILPTLSAIDELIVVDDGSADQSADLLLQLETADSRIRVVRRHKEGRSACWNAGAEAAKGSLLVFCEPDTQFAPGWIDALWAHSQGRQIGAVCPLLDQPEGLQSFQPHVPTCITGEFGFEQAAALIAEWNCGMSFPAKRFESSCIGINRRAFEAMGGWDGALADEVGALDAAHRLSKAGFQTRIASDVIIRDRQPAKAITEVAARQLWEKVAWGCLPDPAPLQVEIWGAEVLGSVDISLDAGMIRAAA